jgi:hypothetical protein
MQKRSSLLAFILAIAIGFLAGRFLSPKPEGQGVPETSSQTMSGTDEAGPAKDGLSGVPEASDPSAKTSKKPLTLEQKIVQIEELKLTASMKNSIRTLELIASMSESELKGMLTQMGKRGMGSMSDWMMPYYVFTAWVEKNPQNAYRFLEEDANPMQQQMYSHSLFSAWAATDPDGALAAVEQITDKQKREQAYGAVTMAIAGKDPNRAYDLLAARDDTNSWQYQMVFMLWAGQDTDAAMAKVESMDIGDERTHALSGVINGMAQKDINRAADIAISLDREQERQQALQTIMQTWINQDIEGAIEFLGQLEDGETKNQVIQNSIWSLARSDPERAMELAQTQMSGQAQDNAVSSVIRQMAREQPEKAAELVANLPYGRVYSNSIRSVAHEWGGEDPMAALAWVDTLGAGEEKDRALSSILNSFADKKPDEAKLYLSKMSESDKRVELAGNIAQKIAENDPREALIWANSLQDEAAVGRASNAAISKWAAQDPQSVVSYLQTTGGDSLLAEHAGTLAYNWARTDVEGAAGWALGLEGKAQQQAIERVSQEWLEHNTEEASIWIADLEAGPARDDAVRNLVNKVYRSDPEAAFAWATTIENERGRSHNAQRAIREMKDEGKVDEARQVIRSSALTDSEKEQLLKTLD